VGSWTNIVGVSAGSYHTVGLRSDGTVVTPGVQFVAMDKGQDELSSWADVLAVSAGGLHTVGLLPSRTVVAAGDNTYGQSDVAGWDLVVPDIRFL